MFVSPYSTSEMDLLLATYVTLELYKIVTSCMTTTPLIFYIKSKCKLFVNFLKFQSINQLIIKCPSGPIGFYKIGS